MLPPTATTLLSIAPAVLPRSQVFVIPHNFLAPIVPKMEGAFAKGAIGCSLIKGIEFEKDGDYKPILISDLLKKVAGVSGPRQSRHRMHP